MGKIGRVSRRFARIAVGIVGLSLMVAITGARAANPPFTTTINGPATVWDGYTCTWNASTDIPNPIYEWQGPGGVVIGTNPSVAYAYDRANGPHQILKLSVHNAAGDSGVDYLLVGVFINGSGNPDCP
jgi:hypothetical protein